jgi:hypothetical protein
MSKYFHEVAFINLYITVLLTFKNNSVTDRFIHGGIGIKYSIVIDIDRFKSDILNLSTIRLINKP